MLPPFQSCLTHLSLVLFYGPFESMSEWVGCCDPSIARKITHLNLFWSGWAGDAFFFIEDSLKNFPTLKVLTLGLSFLPDEENWEWLPVDPRVALYAPQEVYWMFAVGWDDHARGKGDDFWQRAEQIVRQNLPYSQHFGTKWWERGYSA